MEHPTTAEAIALVISYAVLFGGFTLLERAVMAWWCARYPMERLARVPPPQPASEATTLDEPFVEAQDEPTVRKRLPR